MGNPMYRQIAEQLRLRIESGELAPGSQLPTELVLREEFNASRNTVRDAIKWLTNLGLVDTRPGQGTFVAEAIDPFVTTLSGETGLGMGRRRGCQLPVGGKREEPETLKQPGPGRDPAGFRRHCRQAVGLQGRRGHQPTRTTLH